MTKLLTQAAHFLGFHEEKFIGSIDYLEGDMLHGWAATEDFKVVSVRLKVDGIETESVCANSYRPDLEEANIGDGCFSFQIKMPREVAVGNKKQVSLIIEHKDKHFHFLEKEIEKKSKRSAMADVVILGEIDQFVGDQVIGWIATNENDVKPYITANGKPCLVAEIEIERPDLKGFGWKRYFGFSARLPATEFSTIKFDLYGITLQGIKEVTSKTIKGGCLVPDSMSAIFEAKAIAEKENSVGIVVWEGTHNPIGRAQVLYNILKEKRPSVIISFNIGFSEKPVWKPLINSDCKVLMIPWNQRETYAQIFQDINLTFDLVWVCKPRYPAFAMAEMISHSTTKYIVDLDDNELEMSSSAAARDKPYGLLAAKMAQRYLDQLPVRSVASKTLQDDFGGELIRHARVQKSVERERVIAADKEIRVGFIGTIRPHKGIVEAAKAIKFFNSRNTRKIKFVIGGIYNPASIRSELIELGCEVHGEIDSSRLDFHLQNLDVIITGFPDDNANKEILKYQISSKIGDGLSNERPVLVPEGASVNDLSNVPGVFLFNSLNFDRMLEKAVTYSEQIALDDQFTLTWNYEQFLRLEQQANDLSPRGSELFGLEMKEIQPSNHKQNVLLVWKQHDTGLYGRRVDHIARTLVDEGYSVTCLEVLSKIQLESYEKESIRVDSDHRYILADLKKKRQGFTEYGVFYKTVYTDQAHSVESGLNQLILEKKLFPDNTLVVLFPAVPHWPAVCKAFSDYKMICDVVDNQLAWEKKKPLDLLAQYKYMMDISDHVIFNSEENQQYFVNSGFLENKNYCTLPNWYSLHSGFSPDEIKKGRLKQIEKEKVTLDVVYSGNMNDRFDWDTVARIAGETSMPVTIHLAGNCQRALEKMTILLEHENIVYHGPLREKELIKLLMTCDLAIMPHIHDEHSGFMNPMKINMFRMLGLPCVASLVPGVDASYGGVYSAKNSDDFVQVVEVVGKNILEGELSDVRIVEADLSKDYIELVRGIT